MKAAQRLSQRLAVQATKRPSCLFLSPLWPEPSSSAAGVRTLGLVAAFHRWGFSVDYGAGAKPGAHSAALAATGVGIHHCGANREAALAAVVTEDGEGRAAAAPHEDELLAAPPTPAEAKGADVRSLASKLADLKEENAKLQQALRLAALDGRGPLAPANGGGGEKDAFFHEKPT